MINSAIASFSSFEWTTIGIPLANHLWQSTVFAAVAGLVTLLLRKNRAQVRYWLWLAASLKFLLPFSLLIGMGSHLASSKAPASTQPGFTVVVEEIGQPFTTTRPLSPQPAATLPARLGPTLLLLVWFSGFAGVLLFWCVRWRCITAAARRAVPLESGRELEAQRRIERSAPVAPNIKIMASSSALEPGVIGIFRPVLVVPAGIADRLTDAQLEAIIAHELCHVRRRDNLAAALHMLVEAIFWFHPLVWWIGARLVDERERACDEEVLRLGSEPQVYAEGILKVCEFYLESPLVCVAGVTGSNLKKRIEDIMSHRVASKLDFVRKLLLASIGAAAVVVPISVGFINPTSSQAQPQPEAAVSPVFTNVSIRLHPADQPGEIKSLMLREPGSSEWKATNVTVRQLIQSAYGLIQRQISGGPDWLASEKYDISAQVEPSGNPDQIKLKIQNLLAERFKFKFHRETQEQPVYELVAGKNGPKLNEVVTGDVLPHMFHISMSAGHRHLEAKQIGISQLAVFLSSSTGRLVQDKTGIQGVYDFNLDWTQGDSQSVITAVQEQLGFELSPQTTPVERLIIDSAEKPSLDHAEQLSDADSQSRAAVR